MKKKILSILMVALISITSVVPVFAEETNTTKKEDHKIENGIAGKITSINEQYVNIEVATPKKMDPKDKKDTTTNSATKEEKRKIEDLYTLTGEKKTINISKAKFVGNVRIMNANNKGSTDDTKDKGNQEKNKELSYKDFAVGDYIHIVLADDGSNVAKIVSKGGLFRNRPDRKPDTKPDTKQSKGSSTN